MLTIPYRKVGMDENRNHPKIRYLVMQKQGTTLWRVYRAQDGALVAHLSANYLQEEGRLDYWREYLERELYRYNSLQETPLDLLVQVHDVLTTDMRVIPGRHQASSYWVAGSMLFHLPFLEDSGSS
jgi:hypothetical protein